jgi:hypothetical protein
VQFVCKLNTLHCFIRSELLEGFVIEPASLKLKITKHLYAPSLSVGWVGLQCVHSAMVHRQFQDARTKTEDEVSQSSEEKVKEEDKEAVSSNNNHVDINDCAHIARGDEAPMTVFYRNQ